VALLFASSASAQVTPEGNGGGPGILGYAEVLGRKGDAMRADGDLFRQGANGVGLSSRRSIGEDGSRAASKGLIGNWPVAENMQLGLGIYSVTRYSAKERELKRSQPMKDVGERTGSLAAVGLSVRF
jgi:hypothetical protein